MTSSAKFAAIALCLASNAVTLFACESGRALPPQTAYSVTTVSEATVPRQPPLSAPIPLPTLDGEPQPVVMGSSNGSSTANTFAASPSAPPVVSPLDAPVR